MEEVESCLKDPVRPMCSLPGEAGPEEGDEGGQESEGEESREVVFRKPPKGPKPGEMAEHRKTHLPFRAWCPICVRGRGKNWAHMKAAEKKEEERGSSMSFDYCFLRDSPGGELVPVLLGKDRESGTLIAHAVPEKGAGLDWTAKQICRDLTKCGIGGHVVLKGDQEPAIASVIEQVIKLRGDRRTVPEYSPKGESQSNGIAERAVQTIEGLIRSHKLELEEKIGASVPVETPIVTWMIEHCADLYNKYHVFKDGRTSYENVKGKRHRGEMLEFGQKILHRIPGKPQGGLMSQRWMPGVWLGKRYSTEEHVIAMEDGRVVRARAVRSLPAASMWGKEEVMNVIGVPWKPAGVVEGDGERLPDVPRVIIEETEEVEDVKARGFKILPRHLVKVGHTKGCPKCLDLRNGTGDLSRRAHSTQCRKRVEEELQKDEEMRKDVERADQRKNDYLAKKVEERAEADVKKRKTAEADEGRGSASSSSGSRGNQSGQATGGVGESSEGSCPSTEPPLRPASITSPMDTPVPVDDDIELEEVEEEPLRSKRSREEDDDGGEDQPPAVCRQLPALEENRKRSPEEHEEDLGGGKAPRTERNDYIMDLENLREKCDMLELLGLSEKQWRNQGTSMVDIAELFSPPRTAERARRRGYRGGWSLDVAHCDPWTGKTWDLSDEKVKESARRLLRKTRPKVLIASPPCTLFSQMQYLSGGPKDGKAYAEAVKLLEFAIEMCQIQAQAGRIFVFEHPAYARSWRLPCMETLRELKGAQEVIFHMCQFGMTMKDQSGEGPVMKATRVCTNSTAIRDKLDRKCGRDHRHVVLESGRPALAARYPDQLQDAIIDGWRIEDARQCGAEKELLEWVMFTDMCDPEEEEIVRQSLRGIDDVSGKPIDPVLIKRARQEEMIGFKDFEVYEYVLRKTAERDPEGKFVGTRWVDVNKGTEQTPEVRSRLVGQEFAKGEVRDDLFAATPPLVASRLLLSNLASRGRGGPGVHRAMLLDVKKAFLYGMLKRTVYIELPEEDKMSETGQYVGKLKKAMYGLRDAPLVWQGEVRNAMIELGFQPVVSTPCLYYNSLTGVRVLAHVDDFLCTGPKVELKKLLESLGKRYTMKAKMLGPDKGEESTGKFLGRTINWTSRGLEWHGDDKLRNTLLEEWGMNNSSGVNTPGLRDEREKLSEDIKIEDKKRIARFRRGAAQANYLSLDNPKLAFASKEISRGMASPTEGDEKKLKRLVRYLKQEGGVKYMYYWQERPGALHCHADSDWAGCQKTRRSTSGGTIVHGTHLLAHWARTQIGVALSSGEAELNAALKAGCEAIGVQVMSEELGISISINMFGDSSAAKGTLSRQGSGKIKHLETKQLWLQEKILSGVISYTKIPRSVNFSDAMTHYWTAPEGEQHFKRMNIMAVEF